MPHSAGNYLELNLPNQRSVTQYLCGNFARGGCCWLAAPAEGTVTTSLRDTHARAPTHTQKHTLSNSAVQPLAEALNDDLVASLHESLSSSCFQGQVAHYGLITSDAAWTPGPAGSGPCSRATLLLLLQPLQLLLLLILSSLPQLQPWSFQTELSHAPFDEKLQDEKTQRHLEGEKKIRIACWDRCWLTPEWCSTKSFGALDRIRVKDRFQPWCTCLWRGNR